MAIEALEGKETNVSSRKGIFIPGITVEMFRNAPLAGVEELMASGEMEDISLPSAQPERKKGAWINEGRIIRCNRCKIGYATVKGMKSALTYKFCPNCGADMRGEQDED